MKKFILLILSLLFITSTGFAQLSGKVIVIDPGHSGYGPNDRQTSIPGISVTGQRDTYFWESWGNWTKANYLKPMLEARGVTVILTRAHNDYPDGEPSLTARYQVADNNNADWFHSIHSNGGGGQYTLVLYRGQTDNNPRFPAAKVMSDMMAPIIQRHNRTSSTYIYSRADLPFVGYTLGVLGSTQTFSTLSEGSFHDYAPETRRLMNEEYKKNEAYAIRNAFVRYYSESPDPQCIVAGIITDNTIGTPANGVTVSLSGPVSRTYTTDNYSNGYYFFDQLPAGNYTLSITTPGYGGTGLPANFTLTAGENDNALLPSQTIRFQDITVTNIIPATLVSMSPVSGSTISTTSPIVFTFSKSMNRTSVQNAINGASPSASFNFTWSNSDMTVRATPSTPLQNSQSYTISFNSSVVDIVNIGMTPVSVNFSTLSAAQEIPEVIAAYPANGSTNFPVIGTMNIAFSRVMNLTSLQSAITLNGSTTNRILQFNEVDNKTVVTIKPTSDLAPSASYTLAVSTAATNTAGAPMNEARSFTFTTSGYTYTNPITIHNFESNTGWFSLSPSSSGQNAGLLAEGTSSGVSTTIYFPWGINESARRISYAFNNEFTGTHFIRDYCQASSDDETAVTVPFTTSKRLQSYVFGDGSKNLIRFCIRNDVGGTGGYLANDWVTIDWYGWRLLEWDLNAEPGIKVLTDAGNPPPRGNLRLDSYQWNYNKLEGNSVGTVYFDELRFIDVVTAAPAPIASVTPSSVPFGSVNTGTSSAPQTVTIRNTGNASLNITGITSSNPLFTLENATTPITLAAGASRDIQVRFNPTAVGPQTGNIIITHNAAGGPSTVALSGTGLYTGPSIAFSDNPLEFGNVAIHNPSTKNITITNGGGDLLDISQITINGGGHFTLPDGNTSMVVTEGGSRELAVLFLPTAAQNYEGTLILTHNAPGSPTTIVLKGTGTAPGIAITPAGMLEFGDVPITTNTSLPITIRNSGNANLAISIVSVTPNSGFTLSGYTTPINVPGGGTTTINVQFSPTDPIDYFGEVTLTHNVGDGSSTIELWGRGMEPGTPGIQTPALITFAELLMTTSTSPVYQNIEIYNNGTIDLEISEVIISGDNVFTLPDDENTTVTSDNPLIVGPQVRHNLRVQFLPTVTGTFTGAVELIHNARDGLRTIGLTASSVAPSIDITPRSFAFGNVLIGAPPIVEDIAIKNIGSYNLIITAISITNDVGNVFTLPNNENTSVTVANPLTIGVGQSHPLSVQFQTAISGSLSGNITLTHNALEDNGLTAIQLSANGVASPEPSITISPSFVDFGERLIDDPPQVVHITITNDGTAELEITAIAITGNGDFTFPNGENTSITPENPKHVEIGGHYTLDVQFLPVTTGIRQGTIALTHNVPDGQKTITLTGIGTSLGTPEIAITSPTPINFGDVMVNSTGSGYITIENNDGTADLKITAVAVAGTGFVLPDGENTSVTPQNPITVAVGSSHTINVQFRPTTRGSRTGSVTLTHNAEGNSSMIELRGVGVQPSITVTQTVNFEDVMVNTTSARNITIQNGGTANLVISEISITGAAFTLPNSNPITVAPAGRSTLVVEFLPPAIASYTGTVTLKHNGPENNGSNTISLTGNGVYQATPGIEATPSLAFNEVEVNTSSTPQDITIQNSGSADLIITAVAITGDFNLPNNENTTVTTQNPITVAANATQTIRVVFRPTVTGSRTGSVTLTHNASGSSTAVTLTGTGIPQAMAAIELSSTSIAFGEVGLQNNKESSVVISNTGNANLVISTLAITGTDQTLFTVVGNSSNITVNPSANHTATVRFSPNAEGAKSATLQIRTNVGDRNVSLSGTGVVPAISVNEPDDIMGDGSTYLFQSSPNPVRSGYDATIRYRLSTAGTVNMTVYDVLGREMAKIVDEYKSAGVYSVNFNTKGLSSGVYFYKLRTPGYEGLKKMLIIR